MFYREIAPSPDLSELILSFWEFRVPSDTASPIEHEIFPDGCVSLYYFKNSERGLNVIGLTSLQTETVTRPVFAGDTFWGMRISPAACSSILRADPTTLEERSASGADKFSHLLSGLSDAVRKMDSLEQAAVVFESCLRRLSDIVVDEKVSKAVRLIDQANGEVRIDDLAEELGLSSRQFQRRFRQSSGLSPKQFARIRRIRATAAILVEADGVHWADRALEMGFSDQSHMAHEFRAVTKRSPRSFAKKLADIEHGDLVK